MAFAPTYRDTVAPTLSEHALILGNNAHVTDKLVLFSRKQGHKFLMFNEGSKGSLVSGAGIRLCFNWRMSLTLKIGADGISGRDCTACRPAICQHLVKSGRQTSTT